MSEELIIGRNPQNDIVVDQANVSNIHAKITYVGEGRLQIEDLGSTNHTFVNGEKILKKLITPADKITLGSYSLDTENVFKAMTVKIKQNQTDFTKEFLLLKSKYEEYERKVDLLHKGTQTKPIYIKAGLTLAAMALSFFVISDERLKYVVMTMSGVIGGLLSLSNKGNTKIKDEIDRLSVALQHEYNCPKCGYSLMGKRYNYWSALGSCPQCKALWSKK